MSEELKAGMFIFAIIAIVLFLLGFVIGGLVW